MSKLALGHTQQPVQYVPPAAFSVRIMWLGMWLTTHLHLVQSLRMRGAISPLPNMPSRHVQEELYTDCINS
jgi:negative regulator of sigma E activity